jgi:hypothetical protein
MASEDSVEDVIELHPALLAVHVHRIGKSRYVGEPTWLSMHPAIHQVDHATEGLVVACPRGVAHVGSEKREHVLRDRRPRYDGVHQDIRVARLRADPADLEVLHGHFEELASDAMLVDEKLRLEAVAESLRGMTLDRDMHAALAFHQASQKPAPSLLARQAFLLIVRTGAHFHCLQLYRRVAPDSRISQHIARFCNSLLRFDAIS